MVKTVFRKSNSSDLNCIYKILKKLAAEEGMLNHFPKTTKFLNVALFSNDSSSEALVAESHEKIIGIILFSLSNRNFMYSGLGIYLHDLYVIKSYRRQGIATELLKQLIKIAKQHDCQRIDFVINRQNIQACDFYKKIGNAYELDSLNLMRINC